MPRIYADLEALMANGARGYLSLTCEPWLFDSCRARGLWRLPCGVLPVAHRLTRCSRLYGTCVHTTPEEREKKNPSKASK